MGIGAITLPSVSAVTAPTAYPFAFPAANARKARGYGLYSSIQLPGGRGTLFANGIDPLRHVVSSTALRTGLLAPYDEMTVTPSGTQATATLDIDVAGPGSPYNPTAGDILVLNGTQINFVTGFSAVVNQVEILSAATAALTLERLEKWMEGRGIVGVDYNYPTWFPPPSAVIEVSARTATTITFRAIAPGAAGNGLSAYLTGVFGSAWSSNGSGVSSVASFGSLAPNGTQLGSSTNVGYFENGADGTANNNADTDLFGEGEYAYTYSYRRREDGAESGIAEEATGVQSGDFNVALSDLETALSDDDVDDIRVYRTTDGGNVYYRVAEVVDPGTGTTSYTDTLGNLSLSKRVSYDPAIHRLWEDGFIPRVRYLAGYKGRWFGAGVLRASTYTVGYADVTHGSRVVDLVVGYTTVVTKEMEHRTFRITQSGYSPATEYEIVFVDEEEQQIYLDRDYEGANSPSGGLTYEIKDTRDPFTIYYCEPLLPNQTTGTMALEGVVGPDPEGVTGLYEAFESLVVFTRTGIWRLTGSSPTNFRLTQEYEGVGCVSGHGIVLVDGILYWMGADGIYAWTGSGEPYKASSPPATEEGPKGIQRTVNRVNHSHDHLIFAHYDPENRLVRWFVPLDEDVTNRAALVLDLNTRAWAVDVVPDVTCCRTVSDEAGGLRTLAGDVHGNLWELDVSTSDGAYGVTPTWTVASGTQRSLTLTATGLPTLTGIPFLLVNTTTGTFQWVRAASNTTDTIYFSEFLTTAPSAGLKVVLGGIHFQVESGRFTYSAPILLKIFEALRLSFAVATTGRHWFSAAVDQGTATVSSDYLTGLDPTLTDGEELFWVREWGRRLKVRFDSCTPGGGAALQSFETWIRVRDGADGP